MNFTSQICTTKEQSEQLLTLGLKKETADMGIVKSTNEIYISCPTDYSFENSLHIPAWSLHRLIGMVPKEIFHQSKQWHLFFSFYYEDAISYKKCNSSQPCYLHFCSSNNIYDNIIESIEWLITEGHFNKEYLN